MHCLNKKQAVDQLPPIRSFATYQREREHLASHQSYLALHFNEKCDKRNEILANTSIWNSTKIGLKVEDDEQAEEAHSCLFTSN